MKFIVHRSEKMFHAYALKAKRRNLRRSFTHNELISKERRQTFNYNLLSLKTNSISQLHPRCIISGRGRSILTRYKLSRIKFREMVSFGLIPGLRKSSW